MIGQHPNRPCETPAVDDGKRWWQEPRWKNQPPPPSSQWSKQRTRAHADRRHGLIVGDDVGNKSAHGIELARCVSGSAIVAGWHSGEFFAFPLEQRRGDVCIPVGAKWNLRGKRVALLGVIAGAMIGMSVGGQPALGAVMTLDELGEILELRRTQVGEYLHELQAWGLLESVAVYAPFGRVHVQRGNCYRLTKLAALVFRLVLRVQLPDPKPVVPRRKRVRRPVGAPVPAYVLGTGALGSRACELAIGNPDANPETPVPGDSSGEPVSLHRKSSTRLAPLGAASRGVPDATSVLNTAGGVKTKAGDLGSRGPVSANGRAVGDVVDQVREGRDDDASRAARKVRAQLQERAHDEARRRELDDQVARRQRAQELAAAPAAAPTAPAPAAMPVQHAAPQPPAPPDPGVESDEARRLRLERARRRNGIVTPDDDGIVTPDDDTDLADTIAKTFAGRGVDVDNGVIGHFLSTMRKRDRGDGGAS